MKSPWSWALFSGMAYLVPLPFVDEWLARQLLRRALQADGHDAPEVLDALTEDRASMLGGCLKTAVLWPLKKLFKTVLWFLTLKEVVDRAAAGAMVLALARTAREEGWLSARPREVRDAMEVGFGRTDTSPVWRWLTRAERPALDEAAAADFPDRLAQVFRRQAGERYVREHFLQRAEAEGLVRGDTSTRVLPD